MVLSWFSSGADDVASLVAKKSYGKAARILRAQLERDPQNVSLELQLADVLQLDGQAAEAVAILLFAADSYTRNGFLAKAIALLKKVQRIDPDRAAAMDRKIAGLAKERDEETARRMALREAMGVKPRSQDARPRPEAPPPAPEPPPPPAAAIPARDPDLPPPPVPVSRRPVVDLPTPSFEPPVALATPPHSPHGEPGPAAPPPAAARPDFEFELEIAGEEPPADAAAEARLEKTPLFSDFTADELLEVIRGLRLLTFGAGEIVVAEGEPGDSLFVLTTGTVLAFCKDPKGRYHKVREMNEGSFFGEVSILTGMPRTATITAATPIELLELDSATLAEIAGKHPRVHDVLQEFCEARAGSVEEIRIRMGRPGPPPAST
jgi:hypothetical protein